MRQLNLKQLRSFFGALNQISKDVPNLAAFSYPFRTILNKDAEWIWGDEHEKTFNKINKEIQQVSELSHIKRNQDTRIFCNSSKKAKGPFYTNFKKMDNADQSVLRQYFQQNLKQGILYTQYGNEL